MGGWIDTDRVNHIVDTGRCIRRDAKTISYDLKGAKLIGSKISTIEAVLAASTIQDRLAASTVEDDNLTPPLAQVPRPSSPSPPHEEWRRLEEED